MRPLRFRLKTLMIIVAFAALILTVIIQSVLLRRAAILAQAYQVEARRSRDIAAEAAQSRAIIERMYALEKQSSREQERKP
jgi:Tfp pilus assembly protein PilE